MARFPFRPLRILSAAKDDFAGRGVAPVREVLKAGLPGQLGTVEAVQLP